jgi:hypothetical protein
MPASVSRQHEYSASSGVNVDPKGRCLMGDKSPKAKAKQKKQDTVDKNQKKAAADAKQAPKQEGPAKKGK